ncbi:MAG: UMP kinase [Candidatus Methanoplasma sp.]|nr:UMP kinase [Candidatus Methanoplasma sp.]
MNKRKVVVSIGGSVLVPGDDDATYIKGLASMIREASNEAQLVIVCGGGKISRYYSEAGRELGGTVSQLDMLGIGVTRVNAALLALALGDLSSMDVPLTAEDAASRSASDNVVVMGGTAPGHTTDAVAAMVAKHLNADLVVNATSVDAVYSDDPRKVPGAKRFSRLTIKELGEIVYKEHGAGSSGVFDPLGVKIAEENRIDIVIVDGRDLSELRNAILGKEVEGTFVNSH